MCVLRARVLKVDRIKIKQSQSVDILCAACGKQHACLFMQALAGFVFADTHHILALRSFMEQASHLNEHAWALSRCVMVVLNSTSLFILPHKFVCSLYKIYLLV